METEGRPLVTLALEGIDRLDGDDAKEEAIRTLGSVLAGIPLEADLAAASFERLLAASGALEAPWSRTRAFSDVCASLACSRLPRDRRADLLASAVEQARRAAAPQERIDRGRAAVEALAEVRRDEVVEDSLAELAAAASTLDEPRARQRTIGQIALAFAKIGDGDRAVALLDQSAPSAARARALALVAAELAEAGDSDAAAPLLEATIGELRDEPESYESALALRAVLETLLEHDVDLAGVALDGAASGMQRRAGAPPFGVDAALDLVDRMHDARFKRDALLGAIAGLASTTMDADELAATAARVRLSVDRVDETYTRAPLLGELAVTLASRGDARGAERALADVASIASRAEPAEIVDALGDPATAL
ncbi:MAG TPA: hypothetical protein VGM56_30035, partial [Byssovorax sp.]